VHSYENSARQADSENVIFANRIEPQEDDDRSLCSLNVNTGEFWQLRC
jgi:hypothetical protein